MAHGGNLTKAALVRIEYTLDPVTGIPLFTVGNQEDPEPKLTILTATEDTNGREQMGSLLAGADNARELGALAQAWQIITEGVKARNHI